jgi:NAD(P)-dependent dehydrogenase (short-subunit alcohol dehydrogenase family)
MTIAKSAVILVTGATDGIGLGTARELARSGATVLVHGRNPERLAATAKDIAELSPHSRIEPYLADFSSLDDVRQLADDIRKQHKKLDVLINNAGIGSGPAGAKRREVSADGHELRFQVNHLAPFLLQQLLLPLLKAAGSGRIVNVASAAQTAIDFRDVMLERSYDGSRAYAQSKLAMVMASIELSRRPEAREVTVNALHPGSLLDTKMVRESFGRAQGPVEIGIRSEMHVATSAALDGVTGQYFDRTQPARAEAQAYDDTARRRLWQISERLVGLTPVA